MQPIVHHDETLDRTTNCTGRVNQVNWNGYVQYCIAEGVRALGGNEAVEALGTGARCF